MYHYDMGIFEELARARFYAVNADGSALEPPQSAGIEALGGGASNMSEPQARRIEMLAGIASIVGGGDAGLGFNVGGNNAQITRHGAGGWSGDFFRPSDRFSWLDGYGGGVTQSGEGDLSARAHAGGRLPQIGETWGWNADANLSEDESRIMFGLGGRF